MEKILLIAYFYPPITNVGKNRTLRFQKHLENFNYLPIIHTVKNPDRHIVDISSFSHSSGKVYRSYSLNFGLLSNLLNAGFNQIAKLFKKNFPGNPIRRLFFIPDAHIGWIPLCFLSSYALIKKEKIKIIYISCSPFSSAITGILLKKVLKIPVVLDFRDPWSFNPNIAQMGLVLKIHKIFEKWVLKNADYFIANTKTAMKKYVEFYPFLKNKINFIYNGINLINAKNLHNRDHFILLYTGAVYDNEFLDILFSILKADFENLPTKVFFTGIPSTKTKRKIHHYELEKIVCETGYLNNKELIELISKTSLLLFHNGFKENNELKTEVIKSKLFDYLSSGIPILAFVPKGEHTDLIKKYSPQSYIIHSDFKNNLQRCLKNAFREWKENNIQICKSAEFQKDFDGKTLTEQLSRIFDKVISRME